MTRAATITVAAITKRFKDLDAVRDVSFTVRAGEVIGFVGPNGAGKTTTLSILMGYLQASKGSVHILGKKIRPETAHQNHRNIGFVAGDMALPNALTGAQYIQFMASQNGRSQSQYKQLLSQLNPVLDRPIGELSRGNKQKVALIGALQHEPGILLLDEPTSGLDPLMQDVFLEIIRAESARGTTIIMSSHILSEVASICTRILFMRSGRLVMDKPIDQITKQLGKRVTLISPDAPKLEKYAPAYTTEISRNGQSVSFGVPGDKINELLRWLSAKSITDITIEDRELDDVFHELYKEQGAK